MSGRVIKTKHTGFDFYIDYATISLSSSGLGQIGYNLSDYVTMRGRQEVIKDES